jgi:soluble lytic murein transglycosylase-like protein
MSLLNGLGAGLAAFGATGLKDEEDQQRARPLLNSTPAAASVPADGIAGAPGATDATDVPAPTVKGVPPDLIPIYQAASKRTGIPIDVLIAQGKQESNFNPDAIGSAGEIGLHQIKPSTAAQPGYGLKGIDPAMLRDAATNIDFAAAYLKARAGNIDWSDPKQVASALASYNGGGDKAYAQHVLRYTGAG